MGYRLTTSVGQLYVESGAFVTHAIERFRPLLVERRAFCPGASPPDNSCSPANKGIGAPPPRAPSPDLLNARPLVNDLKSVGGYSPEARHEYYQQVRSWLAEQHGVTVTVNGNAPSVPTTNAIAQGVARMAEVGLRPPEEVDVDSISNPAQYDYGIDRIEFNSVFDPEDLDKAVRNGQVVGVAGGDSSFAPLVHEATHRDHFWAVADALVGSEGDDIETKQKRYAAAVERFKNLSGDPEYSLGFVVKRSDPWDPAHRINKSVVLRTDAVLAAGRVSKYATTTPLEFVAEVRTGIVAGKTYDPIVMAVYRAYGGPPLPQVARKKKAA